jgi:tetratricopeptide (TPR) repeat protein
MTRTLDVALSSTGLARLIEVTWLIGLVTIPLAFRGREWVAFFSEPKYFLLHLTALTIVVLWTSEWALRDRRDRAEVSVFDRANTWLGRRPGRWAIVAAIVFGLATVASTLMSPLPQVSLWGRSFDALGYELYSVLSMLVIFMAIALRLRSKNQALRLAGVVVGVSTLAAIYGISQHFGWDPMGRGADERSVLSTLGNPIFFGSFVLMSVGVTLGLGLIFSADGKRYAIPVAAIALSIQLSALWFAGSRGPWIGTGAVLITFGLISWAWLGRDVFLKYLVTIGLAIVVTVVITSIPGGASGARGFDDILDAPGQVFDALRFVISSDESDFSTGPGTQIASDSPVDGIAEFVADPRASALSGRAEIWRSAIKLIGSRQWPFDEPTMVQTLRHLFGYGPDMFYYAYPLEARPKTEFKGVAHAHSYPLHVFVELGLVGFLSLTTTVLLIFWSVIRLFRRAAEPDWKLILAGGVLAALVGRMVEQGVGIGRVSDLVLFWALAGFAIALTEVAGKPDSVKRSDQRQPGRRRRRSASIAAMPILVAIIVLVSATTLFVLKDVRSIRAGWLAANAFELKADGRSDESFKLFELANDLAPRIERYSLEIAGFLSRTATSKTDTDSRRTFTLAAHERLADFEDRDPYAWDTQLRLVGLTSGLVELGDTSRVPESVARESGLAALLPHIPVVQARAAEAVVRAGEWQLALELANNAIAMEPQTAAVPSAWWARGEALLQLDQLSEAERSFETAISRAKDSSYAGSSHRGLAVLAELRGDLESAEEHAALASAIELAILAR